MQVVDPSGASVPDATVVLRRPGGEAVAEGVTGRLATQSPGFGPQRFHVGVDLWQGASCYGATNLGSKFFSEHLPSLNPFTRGRVPEMGRALTTGQTMSWQEAAQGRRARQTEVLRPYFLLKRSMRPSESTSLRLPV